MQINPLVLKLNQNVYYIVTIFDPMFLIVVFQNVYPTCFNAIMAYVFIRVRSATEITTAETCQMKSNNVVIIFDHTRNIILVSFRICFL